MAASENKYALVMIEITRDGCRYLHHASVSSSFEELKNRFITTMDKWKEEQFKEQGFIEDENEDKDLWPRTRNDDESIAEIGEKIGAMTDETFADIQELFPNDEIDPLMEVFVQQADA